MKMRFINWNRDTQFGYFFEKKNRSDFRFGIETYFIHWKMSLSGGGGGGNNANNAQSLAAEGVVERGR